ncbi:MAG: NTP transferase domain-containing protein, partial [Dehalococcoidales bacterium]
MKPNRFAAIILAAGLSRRMGQFKPLLLIGGETITDRVASLFLENGVDVILVTGWQGNSLIDGIKS